MSASEFKRTRYAAVQWRNWSLLTKLAAVVLVPVIFAITLGIGQIRWQVDQAADYTQVAQVVDAVDRIEPLIAGVQHERTRSVEFLVGDNNTAALDEQAVAVDRAAGDLARIITSSDVYGPVVSDRYRELRPLLDGLRQLRQQVRNHQLSPDQTIGAYTRVITAVLALDRALTSSVADRSLSSTATALQDMLGLTEEVRLQQAWVLTGLTEGSLSPVALDNLLGSRARLVGKIGDARSTVAAHWQQRLDMTLGAPEIANRNRMLAAILTESTDNRYTGGYSVQRDAWNAATDGSVTLIDQGHDDLAADVRATAARLEAEASDAAGWDSVLLLSALIAAAAIIIVIARQLLGSLRVLRRGALDAAEYDLPAAVAAIRQGDTANATVEPVPVHTTDEVGQLARAFDEVNQQALRLAVEQADLRRGYSEVFVSVSRRSQSLLERQLRLFEQLEQDEEDPDQLARLFQLDHLATRMRRNNENLMVLSGSDLARRFGRPTDLADVLRSAVSEIEQYPRVVVQPPPAVKLRGHTASDLVRLIAELLDNAANFSAPDTSVTVSSYQAGDGTVVLDVLDQGIGMGYSELARANERLAHVDEDDLATSRRMGLFVAGRLAVRHGIGVELHGGPDVEGVRATVMIPSEHMVSTESGPALQPSAAQPAERNGHAHTELPTSGFFPRADEQVEAAQEVSPWQEPAPASLFEPSAPLSDDPPTAHLFDAPIDIPQQPRAVSSADFAVDWPGVEPPAEQPAEADSPMYQEPSTQWFQPASENPMLQGKTGTSSGEFSWPSAESEQAPAAEPTGFAPASPDPLAGEPRAEEPSLTSSGLPRRTPRGEQAAEAPTRSAEDISRQLAHNGVQFGHSAEAPAETPAETSGANSWTSDSWTPESWTSEAAGSDNWAQLAGSDSSWAAEPAEVHPWDLNSSEAQAWSFASERAREAAEAAANPEQSSFTQAGLPRRTPKANLVPGSVSNAEPATSSGMFQRDPDQLRGRLADFQSGISRGRHRATDED
ncbi:nitrate- and nitrite sensing domain-containing protein [Saccharopolyspora sp. K220]|uniref:sensor histidine kinase n=1 Tax=Saccharopolyspora soli TaxID=2926618 RepID=UPI001F5A229E|nr:nitrate- and nitrite sensing domain-containing protein [Saccharopolyspora soli]MCI2423817.1 nitrate- and nitrite sensing domain-containing protein [Saccharopolyspora soli]